MKDYGGPSGLKTISQRGLGTEHTLLLLNGLPVNSMHNGGFDLGLLSSYRHRPYRSRAGRTIGPAGRERGCRCRECSHANDGRRRIGRRRDDHRSVRLSPLPRGRRERNPPDRMARQHGPRNERGGFSVHVPEWTASRSRWSVRMPTLPPIDFPRRVATPLSPPTPVLLLRRTHGCRTRSSRHCRRPVQFQQSTAGGPDRTSAGVGHGYSILLCELGDADPGAIRISAVPGPGSDDRICARRQLYDFPRDACRIARGDRSRCRPPSVRRRRSGCRAGGREHVSGRCLPDPVGCGARRRTERARNS